MMGIDHIGTAGENGDFAFPEEHPPAIDAKGTSPALIIDFPQRGNGGHADFVLHGEHTGKIFQDEIAEVADLPQQSTS